MDVVEECFLGRQWSPCARSTGHGNHFELMPTVKMESQHSVGSLTCHEFPRFVFISEISRPEVRSRWRFFSKSCLFEKRPLTGKFTKICFKRFHRLADPRLVCKFREIWPTGSRRNRALLASQKKFRLAPSLSLLRGSLQKSTRASSSQCTRSTPNFIQIGSLSVGVIAERVNTVQTRHKVFPILGEASSPSNKIRETTACCYDNNDGITTKHKRWRSALHLYHSTSHCPATLPPEVIRHAALLRCTEPCGRRPTYLLTYLLRPYSIYET